VAAPSSTTQIAAAPPPTAAPLPLNRHSVAEQVLPLNDDSVAEQVSTENSHSAKVVDLATERDKRLQTQQHSFATRGKKSLRKNLPLDAGGKPYLEAVKASKGTWVFRLRRSEKGKRTPPIYLDRVSDEIYEFIRKGDYESFKKQLIETHTASALRAGIRA